MSRYQNAQDAQLCIAGMNITMRESIMKPGACAEIVAFGSPLRADSFLGNPMKNGSQAMEASWIGPSQQHEECTAEHRRSSGRKPQNARFPPLIGIALAGEAPL